MSEEHPNLRDWEVLTPDEQLRLREAYGRHLDGQPATCDMQTKIERFRHWLREHGINYAGSH